MYNHIYIYIYIIYIYIYMNTPVFRFPDPWALRAASLG